jgi:hypothetical protein
MLATVPSTHGEDARAADFAWPTKLKRCLERCGARVHAFASGQAQHARPVTPAFATSR